MNIDIVEVEDKNQLKEFVRFPYDHYRGHPVWVPPLKVMAKREFDVKRNNFFKHADPVFFLAMSGDRVLGRIAAFVNHGHLKYHKDAVGFFGSFEAINDKEVARALVDSTYKCNFSSRKER